MLENTWYNVISPESCSSILWRSWEYKEQAAEALRLTAPDLLEQGIIDRIVEEPLGGAHRNHAEAALRLKNTLLDELRQLRTLRPEQLRKNRIKKFGQMGEFDS
jgi:acetyl-CoA carboxylase carboxyl transferase subunit alpha